ncbi:MAG: nicotinate-nucleotide adenylyltransferase [Desulfovibrionaceae bacterium]|nr:nicotinate-nucleotide adenylyltransferase [Desulfovibrionaceae bacterium]
MTDIHPLGFIHGRFQILHNDHLTYLLAGKRLCKHLIIGVTNPDAASTRDEAADPARSSRANNPLSYEERATMIRAALVEAGVDPETFDIVPFPICRPELYDRHCPAEAVYFLTIYDDWGREKKRRFEAHGLRTQVLWERPSSEKDIEGKNVRAAIRDGREWRHLVPPSVAKLVDEWDLAGRLREK